jgi:hypothetical protein
MLDAGDLSAAHTARVRLPGQKAGWIQESIWTFIIIIIITTIIIIIIIIITSLP